MLNIALYVPACALLARMVGSLAALDSPALWVLIMAGAIASRMVIDTGKALFTLDDYVYVLAAFVLPRDQWAAFALAAVVGSLLVATTAADAIMNVANELLVSGSALAGAVLFAESLPGAWGVMFGGVFGILLASVSSAFHSSCRSMWGQPKSARASVFRTWLDSLHEEIGGTVFFIGMGVSLAVLCWLAMANSVVAPLIPLLPCLIVWGLLKSQRRAHAVEQELEEARRRMNVDPLTGLSHREHFFDQALQQVLEARRRQEPLSLMMCDLDHFKQLNDTLGHQAGDRAIVLAADALRTSVAGDGFVGRYGGEEFVALLPGVEPEAACRQVGEIAAAVVAGLAEFGTTVSIGVAHLRENDRAAPLGARGGMRRIHVEDGSASSTMHSYMWATGMLEELVRRADAALYQAKADGRDCVREWNGESAGGEVLESAA